MDDSAQPRPSTGRRLLWHVIRLVIGVVSLGGLVLLVYLVVDAVVGGSVFFIVATVIMLVFGAPVFVLGLLVVTRPGFNRRLFRRLHVQPPSSPPPAPHS